MQNTLVGKRGKTISSSKGGHGHFRHVARPATLGEFLASLGMSKRRYEQTVEKHMTSKAGQLVRKS